MRHSVELVPVRDRERWIAAHAADGRPSQSWNYAWGLCAFGIEPTLAVVDAGGARMLMPFFERGYAGTTDVATTVGLSGASSSCGSAAPFERWRAFAEERGWVAGYAQLDIYEPAAASLPPAEVVAGKTTLVLDLDAYAERPPPSRNLQQKIEAMREAGATALLDPRRAGEALAQLYPQTLARFGTPASHAFGPQTLARWCDDPTSLALGAEVDGVCIAVALFLTAGPRAEWWLIGSTDRGRAASAWLIDEAAKRLRERGVRWLNLGGGAEPDDGLYRFKRRFGAEPHTQYGLRQVYDGATYDELCRAAGVTPAAPRFPAYR